MEWSSNSLSAVFATPGNAVDPSFYAFLKDVLRFNSCVRLPACGKRIRSTAQCPPAPQRGAQVPGDGGHHHNHGGVPCC